MNADPFYTSTRWRALRRSIMRRDGYMCQISKRYGRMVQAQVVHHIFPREEFPEYQFEPWNLISVTIEQHHKLHDRTNNRLSREGIELLRRTARRNNIAVPLQYQ